MTCVDAKESIAASWLPGNVAAATEAALAEHVAGCAECSAEMAQLSALWLRLGELPAPEPSRDLSVRWEATLESLVKPRRQKSWKFTLASLWPQRPVWQVTIALACLVVGILAGSYRGNEHRNEIASLREEVAAAKEMVALSLLQQQSAGERLRGVGYTVRMATVEPEVIAALVQAVSHDTNVNVRLAAIDALSRASGNQQVRQSMVQSLGEQDSPMVQAALIDYLVDARDRGAVSTLQQLSGRPGLNPSVRRRANRAMQQLTEFK